MRLLPRIAALETLHTARLDAMTDTELLAIVERRCGPGAGAWLDAYLDGLDTPALDRLAADEAEAQRQCWGAFVRWQKGTL